MDGIQGPVLSGTGYFLKRKALYTSPGVKGMLEIYLHSLGLILVIARDIILDVQYYRFNL